MKAKILIVGGFAVLVLAALLAFGYGFAAAQETPVAPTPQPPGVPYLEAWEKGPHSQAEKEAFVHWDEDDPKEVPANCAQCHTTTGYQEYVATGAVEKGQPTGQVITCEACHSPAAVALDKVTFPSGVEITGLGGEARCMVCHQGRESMVSVDKKLEDYKAADPAAADKVPAPIKNAAGTDAPMGFTNIHYKAAAATLYGSQVMGGYQYAGKTYDFKNAHVEQADTCIECHDSHTGEVQVETCKLCHEDQVKTAADVAKIRYAITSAKDYDGDGDIKEPIKGEVEGLQAALLKTIQAYAKEVGGAEIKYDGATYPYFMGADGKAYTKWTPRLLKAAYNYQFSLKDPGQYAHNSRYNIELLYDSIEDLNAAAGLKTKTDQTKMNREDFGHFNGTGMAFRDWDADGEVPATCAKCHSASGLPQIFANAGVTIVTDSTNKALSSLAQPISNGFMCSTCHDEANWPNRYFAAAVKFPSGKDAWFAEADANLCLNCHQGRQSKASVDAYLTRLGATEKPDEVAKDKDGKPAISFRNPHYFAAGATLLGTEVQGGYEYDEQKYSGRTMHPAVPPATSLDCSNCHDVHTLELKTDACATCHAGVKSLEEVRKPGDTVDYDGDGNTTEGFAGEIETMQELLWTEIADYAKNTAKLAIVYDDHTYPYFLIDKNGNGKVDPDEATRENGFNAFTAKLLKAAYNYQWVSKDPGAFAHNFTYANQLLYDSIKDLGGDVAKLKRAEVTAGAVPEQPKAPEAP